MAKKPCPDCGKLIQNRSIRCSSCTRKSQWQDPEQRERRINGIKDAQPPTERPHCVDCGKLLKTLGAQRCVKCSNSYHATKNPKWLHTQVTRDKISNAIKSKFQNDPEFTTRWRESITARSADPVWRQKQRDGAKARSARLSWIENHALMVKRVAASDEWREAMSVNPCWQRGALHPSWRGGSKNERQAARNHSEYKRWRITVFERDDYTCQTCGSKGGALHAHHIEQWADNPEVRYEPDNGVTLCVLCHRIVHGHYIPA